MKRLYFLNLLLILLAMGLILAGCDFDLYEPQVLTGTVTITGGSNPPKVGETLTAVYAPGNGAGTVLWQWFRGDDAITNALRNTYTVTTADVGRRLKVRANYANRTGSVISSPTSAVVAASFVPVTDITGVPTTGTVGTLNLTGTVTPSNANNRTIAWSVKSPGTTGATIAPGNGTLTTTAAGTVVVTATITNGTAQGTNFTKDFTITINAVSSFVPVTDIVSGFPSTVPAGAPLILTGTVVPDNANNKAITWSVVSAGSTGASISGNTLTTAAAGAVTIRATVVNGTAQGTNYTKNFSVTINAVTGFVAVNNITGIPTTWTAGIPLTLNGTVEPSNATYKTIVWTVISSTTGASIDRNTIIASQGTVTVKATIINGGPPQGTPPQGTDYTKSFTITIAPFVGVNIIKNVPTSGAVGIPLTLSGTVDPPNAFNPAITWSVQDAGSTGATITGNTLTARATGTATVRATIANGESLGKAYTQNFSITISRFIPVTAIDGIPTSGSKGVPIILTGTVAPGNASCKTITWSVKSSLSGVSLDLEANTLTVNAVGNVELTATIVNGTAAGTNFTRVVNVQINE